MSPAERRILLIEDEPGLVLTLSDRLAAEGFAVECCQDGQSGLERASAGAFDLILLDLMLPRRSGLDVCRELRREGVPTPILMLTARSQVIDKVVGLQIGADDYLTKPFDMMELLARIEALLRRVPRTPGPAAQAFRFGSVTVNLKSGEVRRGDELQTLSAKEFQLLRYLIEHRGVIVSREELLREVWGYEALPSTRTVDVHMTWLRQKLEDNPKLPVHILTVRGLGYKLDA